MSDYFGSFGKMPSVGDFFRIHPPPGFVNVWDAWIQSAMVTGSELLRERWDESYMSAPIWRFTLSPGLAGEGKVMGVLMPSVDRVGRRFPLTLTARLDTGGPVARDHFRQDPLFEKMEQTALSALDDDMTRDRLEQALSALPPPAAPVPILVRRGGDGSVAITQAGDNAILAELAAAGLPGPRSASSLWSCAVDGIRRLMVCQGLPMDHEMLALFDLGGSFWQEGRTA